MNYRFNIDEWLPRFPLQEDLGRSYMGEIVTSPWHICQNEQLRRELRDQYDWGPAVLMDVFVMAVGEPADRHVTKIGGLPYRPANAKWPRGRDGNPCVFIGQFNFCDSKDITGPLAGDVLLVFADESRVPRHLHFEWQSLGLTGLAEHDAMPQTNVIGPCYGHIHRTLSYPDCQLRNDTAQYPMCRGKEVWSDYLVPTYQATQIGPAPFFTQDGDFEAVQGRVLCTISSVQPACDVAYPWINCPEPIPLASRLYDEYLMLGDMGCIYICIDEQDRLHWHESCY